MKLVIPLHSLYWSIHTKDEGKRGTAFAFIFGVNWLWRCGVTASFGVFFHEIKYNGMTSFMEFMYWACDFDILSWAVIHRLHLRIIWGCIFLTWFLKLDDTIHKRWTDEPRELAIGTLPSIGFKSWSLSLKGYLGLFACFQNDKQCCDELWNY